MVMKLHTGVPGAGKSYLLIKSFVDSFCDFNKEIDSWEIKPSLGNIRLISNIEGLTLDHENLDVLISERCQALADRHVLEMETGRAAVGKDDQKALLENREGVVQSYYLEFMQERIRWFFNDEYQKSLAADCSLIYLIEESQRYFDTSELGRKPWVRDVLYFFERHRHHGISMFFDTQHSSKLHKGIVALFEEEIRAKPRTLSVMGEFRYNSFCDGLKTNQVPIVVKPDKRIFRAYSSMTASEAVKPKRPFLKIGVFLLVVTGLAYGAYRYSIYEIGPESVQAANIPKGVPQGGVPQGGVPQGGVPQGGVPQGGVPQGGVSQGGVPQGEWVHVSHVMKENNDVWVIHPQFNTILPLKKLDLDVKVIGTSLFAFIPASN